MSAMTAYHDFIAQKKIRAQGHGIEISESQINPILFPFQRAVTKWAIGKGRCALFLDTGLGKTFCQLEWARLINKKTLIIAPLSVARQTVREAKKINLDIKYVRAQSEIDDHQIFITNYEMFEAFSGDFGAVVLDESSILKSLAGKTRRKLINRFKDTPFRLCCTATPAPNDYSELGQHAEFLDICSFAEMLSMFFIHANKVKEHVMADNTILRIKQSNKLGQEWRLKYHAKGSFFLWLSSWAMSMKKPSDLAFEDDGFILPSLNIKPIYVNVDYRPDDALFFMGLKGIQDRQKVRRSTLNKRADEVVGLINGNHDQWIIWCGLNEEAKVLKNLIPNSVEVKGSDSIDHKINTLEGFQDGQLRVMITKPKIAGHGMNFQNAHNMVFMGIGDSWESYYQCIRREWRFGQINPVNVYIVLSNIESEIYENVLRKERMAEFMHQELIDIVRDFEQEELGIAAQKGLEYKEETIRCEKYIAMLGDSTTRLKEIEDESIDLSVYSPPFADLYTYSPSNFDLGNSRDWDEFFHHYSFIIQEILRVTKQGRISCVHTSDIPAMALKDGYIGMRDFPGEVIKAHEKEGWVFVGRAIVAKNPQAQAIRTKSKALLFAQLRKDSSECRPAILDQILIFKKQGMAEVKVTPVKNGEMNNEVWINWAGGIWTGIHEPDVLRYTEARAKEDEKHICPLQLGTIERCIKLYSNPGETVLTPFMGIGSEAYQAVKFHRKAIGIELKESYFSIAVQNLKNIEDEMMTPNLFNYDH